MGAPLNDRAEVQVPGSFDAFYREHYPQVVALVYSLTGSRWGAEDLAQDAFLQANRDWAKVGVYDSPAGWIRTVAVNAARSRFRRMSAEARALRRWIGMEPTAFPALDEPFEEFWAEVRKLPRRQSEVVALHYLDDMAVDDIAAVLDIAPSSVKNSLAQARSNLATRLQRLGVTS